MRTKDAIGGALSSLLLSLDTVDSGDSGGLRDQRLRPGMKREDNCGRQTHDDVVQCDTQNRRNAKKLNSAQEEGSLRDSRSGAKG